MRLSGYPRFGPALVVFGVVASALILFLIHVPAARAQCGTATSAPCPTPSPSPIPVHAFLSLDVTSGDATTVVNVTGGQFLPNEQVSLYWDDSSKVAAGATADGGGSFNTRVKPFSSDAPGVHKLCAGVPPNPCANFTLLAPVAATSPSPSPSQSPSPSAEGGPSGVPSVSPAATVNGLNVITSPPFVFLPIVGGLAILLSLGYWFVNYMRRPRVAPLPSAAVVHRATRPDYKAGFGSAPPAPAATPEPSAWNEPIRHATPQAQEPPPQAAPPQQPPQAEPPAAESGPPVEWGTGRGDWGFPEPPEVDESADIPQPGD